MLKAYLNYPNSRVTVHGDSTCEEIEKMEKQGQRRVSAIADLCCQFPVFAASEWVHDIGSHGLPPDDGIPIHTLKHPLIFSQDGEHSLV